MSDSNNVLYGTVPDSEGSGHVTAPLTPTDDQRDKITLAKPYIIPIIFIPGIMGTNLCKKGSKDIAWRPPNMDARGILDAIGQLLTYANKTAKERQSDLKTEETVVDLRGSINTAGTGLKEKVLVARGWGALMRSSYHSFMGELQNQLNDLAKFDFKRCEADLQSWAKDAGQEPPTEWGATNGTVLGKDEVLHAANYQFDVWAAGYNWLQSNGDSGAAIKTYIENVVLPYYNEGKEVVVKDKQDGEGNGQCSIQRSKPKRSLAEKVIVVTHSMGGLVSRALTEIHHCDKVLGVIHGVQPATGAPATYKRMRAGFEGVEQVILGRDASEVVAVLAQAPGGLELLPTADYNDGQPWLKARDHKDAPCSLALPTANGNPYDEIYLSPKWYGLVPERNTGLMSPGVDQPAPTTSVTRKDKTENPRDTLSQVIGKVRKFHEAIEKKYKKPTYTHFGAQGQRNSEKDRGGFLYTGLGASKNLYAWCDAIWEGPGASKLDVDKVALAKDDGNGGIQLSNGVKLEIAGPDCPGDGTVPLHSGAAPGRAGVAMSFAHGQGNPGKHNDAFGYDHQGSYGDKHKRSLYASMYGIIKIAQQAQWHKK